MSSRTVALSCYNENIARNANRVTIGDVDFYFSYKNVVAVAFNGRRHVSKNVWSAATGKHLNWIDGGNKAARLDSQEFTKKVAEAIKACAGTTERMAASAPDLLTALRLEKGWKGWTEDIVNANDNGKNLNSDQA